MENEADGNDRSRYEILRKKIGSETSVIDIVFRGPSSSGESREGDMVFEGQDLGPIVEEMFGDFDFEYNYTIKENDVDLFIASLVKECFDKGIFETGGQLRKWMEEHNIPFTTWSWT